MESTQKKKKAGILIALCVIGILVVTGVFASGILSPQTSIQYPVEHLFVDATYLLKTSETNETVNVTCTPYLTNIWKKASGEIKTTVYVIETSDNLAVYKNTVDIGEIKADSTAEIEIPIILSNSSYKVEILIFENNKLMIKGVITISAYPIYSWDEIIHGIHQQWQVNNSGSYFESLQSYSK
jgi:hypothetical protein